MVLDCLEPHWVFSAGKRVGHEAEDEPSNLIYYDTRLTALMNITSPQRRTRRAGFGRHGTGCDGRWFRTKWPDSTRNLMRSEHLSNVTGHVRVKNLKLEPGILHFRRSQAVHSHVQPTFPRGSAFERIFPAEFRHRLLRSLQVTHAPRIEFIAQAAEFPVVPDRRKRVRVERACLLAWSGSTESW